MKKQTIQKKNGQKLYAGSSQEKKYKWPKKYEKMTNFLKKCKLK